MKAILNNPCFKSVLLLPFLVYEVIREKNYYLTHGEFSAGTILIWGTFAVMAGASVIYWFVRVIRRRWQARNGPH